MSEAETPHVVVVEDDQVNRDAQNVRSRNSQSCKFVRSPLR